MFVKQPGFAVSAKCSLFCDIVFHHTSSKKYYPGHTKAHKIDKNIKELYENAEEGALLKRH